MTPADAETESDTGRVYDIAFVLEQALGHITHGSNLRDHVPDDPAVRAHWLPLPFEPEDAELGFPISRANWTVRAGLTARRSLRRLPVQPDALFVHTQVPAMLLPDHLRRVPSIVSVDATPRQYDELGAHYDHRRRPAPVERMKHAIATRCFGAAHHVVTWSEWARRGVLADYGLPDDRVTVVPPGVTVTRWERPGPARPPTDGRRRSEPVRILFVGGDLARKGGDVLVAAAAMLRDLHVEFHLVTGAAVAPATPGLVVHRGLTANSPELIRLYHQCDVFALPTFADCLPMVLSEAAAAGLPAIATPVAGIPEIVLHGRTGLLVEPGSVGDLAEALRHLVTRPDVRHAMGTAAVMHVRDRYDTAVNTRTLVDLLKRSAAPRRLPPGH